MTKSLYIYIDIYIDIDIDIDIYTGAVKPWGHRFPHKTVVRSIILGHKCRVRVVIERHTFSSYPSPRCAIFAT